MALCQIYNHFNCLNSKTALFIKAFQTNSFSLRSISSTNAICAKDSSEYVTPNQDPVFYAENPPSKADEISHKIVCAAETSVTYSTFYDSQLYKFEKLILKRGQSLISKKIVRGTMEYIKSVQVKKYNHASDEEKKDIETCPLKIFHQAMENAKPLVTVKVVNKGGRNYQIPTLVPPKKHLFLVAKTMRLHIMSGHPNTEAETRLGKEILAAYNNEGAAVRAKLELHKKAYANRAYANVI